MTKRIWLAPSAFFPARGGVEEVTLQLARELQRRGHAISVIVHQHPASLPLCSEVEGVPVARIPLDLPGSSPIRLATYPLTLALQLKRLRQLGPLPDVIHVHCAANQVIPLTAYAALRQVPLVITTHGEVIGDAEGIYQNSVQMRASLRLGTHGAAALTAVSRRAGDDAAEIASLFATCEVVPNGIDPMQWTVTEVPDEPVFAAWGRHVPQKGFDLLMLAFTKVREALPNAILRIGGAGPDTPLLRQLACDGVEFVGELDRPGVQSLLDGARVAVVPSRVDAFGLVALEAMAVGRTVVWSTRSGLGDATGGMGWGVDPTDCGALAVAMIEANSHPVLPSSARAHAESMSWARIADRYTKIYNAVRKH